VAVAQGRLSDAAQLYGEYLEIAKSLAARDAGNTQWQRDLFVSNWKLADLAEKRDQPQQARDYWRASYEALAGIERQCPGQIKVDTSIGKIRRPSARIV